MRPTLLSRVAWTAVIGVVMTPFAFAINISVQYAPGTLFYSGIDGTAKATINAAAADVSNAITSSLNAITTDIYMGSSGSTTATFDWNYRYTNPSTGSTTVINSATAPADTVTIFVGATSHYGDVLGQGGPSAIGFNVSVSGPIGQAQAAITAAGNASETGLLRGGGPSIRTIDDPLNFGGGNVFDLSVDYGIAYGSLSFDNDKDDNGVADNAATLDTYWHWNYNTPVASGKNDLYSVALHEILHAVGFGLSNSWDSYASGTTWNGPEVQALLGSGANKIQNGGGHVAQSVMGRRLSDNTLQPAVMTPKVEVGTRQELTDVDLAFLRDIGYETITPTIIYDTADYDTDGDVDGSDLAILENWYSTNAQGDADGDGDTDGSDLLIWQRQYTGTITPLVATVPEPSSVLLLTCFVFFQRRRR